MSWKLWKYFPVFYFPPIFTLAWCSDTQCSRYELIVSKMNRNIYPHKSIIKLEKLSGNIIEASSTGRIVKSKEMKKIFPWNTQCEQCKIKVMLWLDAKSQGQLEYFKKSKIISYWAYFSFKQQVSYTKWLTQLLKKLILIRVNTRKFSCYTEKNLEIITIRFIFPVNSLSLLQFSHSTSARI